MAKQMTNVECVTDIMEFSRFGALAQAFVMDVLSKHARQVAETPIEALREAFGENPMIGADAWQGVAKEIHTKLEAHFAR